MIGGNYWSTLLKWRQVHSDQFLKQLHVVIIRCSLDLDIQGGRLWSFLWYNCYHRVSKSCCRGQEFTETTLRRVQESLEILVTSLWLLWEQIYHSFKNVQNWMNMAVSICNSGREIKNPNKHFETSWRLFYFEGLVGSIHQDLNDKRPLITEHQEDLTVNKGNQTESVSRVRRAGVTIRTWDHSSILRCTIVS